MKFIELEEVRCHFSHKADKVIIFAVSTYENKQGWQILLKLYCWIEARVHSSRLNDHMITTCLRFLLAETQNRRILQDLQQKRQMLLNQGQGGVGNVG